MADSNSSSTTNISLPKGGGALKGIGETFSPDLFTGTGNFTIPIEVPSGRNGFQPQLSLGYSTGNGNGPFGLGWNLSIPGVARKTSKGIPRYRDHDPELSMRDTFILSGAEDLVPVGEFAPGVVRYRPRTEGLFARILHHEDAQNNFWEVQSKDGLVSLYGTPQAVGVDPAIIADPQNRHHIFAWKLTETRDPFGNVIRYSYRREEVREDGPHNWDQLYVDRIQYIDFQTDGSEETQFLVSVSFHYEDRPDPFSEYRPGFEIRTTKRCTHIEVHTHPNETHHVRTYQFRYLDEREGLEHELPLNGTSVLSQFLIEGHREGETQHLPPLEFSYTQFSPAGRDFFPLEGADLPVSSLASPQLELVDLFGNGLPDFLEMNGAVRYWRNLGNGKFDLPRLMKEAPAGLQLGTPGVQLGDADGNGQPDLIVTTRGLSGYYPLQREGGWSRQSFRRYSHSPSVGLQDPSVALADLTGDGVMDAIRSGNRLECYFNDPQEGWSETRRVTRQHDLREFPDVNFSDPRVKWADLSGDGLQDIVLVHDGNIEYWPNLGYGNWGKRIHMRNSPRFPAGYTPQQILIGDVDGDGLADLVFVDHCKVTLWINQSGNGWSAPIEIDGTPPISNSDSLRLEDLLGTGVSGVLWSREVFDTPRDHHFFLDFTGGVKPYVLNQMNNHMGALTQVKYRSSIEEYLRDQAQPETRWKTTLPFPVQVVSCVEVIDELSGGKLTTEYKYHHGYWDGGEREFRGFGFVEQCDTETFDIYHSPGLHDENRHFEPIEREHFSPPTLTKIWHHLGPVGPEFGDWDEIDCRHEYWDGDPGVWDQVTDVEESLSSSVEAHLQSHHIPSFLAGIADRRVKRDAMRTLRGSVLRTELYALDGGEEKIAPIR